MRWYCLNFLLYIVNIIIYIIMILWYCETFQNHQFDFSNVLSSRKDANAKEGTRKKDEQDRKGNKDTKVMTVLVKSTESSYWKL